MKNNCVSLIFICFLFASIVCAIEPGPTEAPKFAKNQNDLLGGKYEKFVTVGVTEGKETVTIKMNKDLKDAFPIVKKGKEAKIKMILKQYDEEFPKSSPKFEDCYGGATGASVTFAKQGGEPECGFSYAWKPAETLYNVTTPPYFQADPALLINCDGTEDILKLKSKSDPQEVLVEVECGTTEGCKITFTDNNQGDSSIKDKQLKCNPIYPISGFEDDYFPFALRVEGFKDCDMAMKFQDGYVFPLNVDIPPLRTTNPVSTTSSLSTTAGTTTSAKPTSTTTKERKDSTTTSPEQKDSTNSTSEPKSTVEPEPFDTLYLWIALGVLLGLIAILVIANIFIYLRNKAHGEPEEKKNEGNEKND